MDISRFTVVWLPVVGGLVFLVLFVAPPLRLKRSTGESGFMLFRSDSSAERVVGVGLACLTAGVMAWLLVLALSGPGRLNIWNTRPGLQALGWALIISGASVVALAQRQMGTSWRVGIDPRPTTLVTHGLFSLVRNPIFAGVLLLLLGVVLLTPSPWTISGWLHALLLVALQARLEEEHLARVHGPRYLDYATRVGRFVPWLGLLDSKAGAPRRDR